MEEKNITRKYILQQCMLMVVRMAIPYPGVAVRKLIFEGL